MPPCGACRSYSFARTTVPGRGRRARAIRRSVHASSDLCSIAKSVGMGPCGSMVPMRSAVRAGGERASRAAAPARAGVPRGGHQALARQQPAVARTSDRHDRPAYGDGRDRAERRASRLAREPRSDPAARPHARGRRPCRPHCLARCHRARAHRGCGQLRAREPLSGGRDRVRPRVR